MPELYRQAEAALLESDPCEKCVLTAALRQDWERGVLSLEPAGACLALDDPGRPALPRLVDPRQLERRSFATDSGRIKLLHAFTHIEFNAINIALDAVYRFRHMPPAFIGDWLQVAAEEAQHFQLLESELRRRGSFYGAHVAHAGLWDMVCNTRDNLLHRMALVPRVMEARGLDVTPGMISRFEQFGDSAAVAILQIIYRDEVGHVRIGDRWYRYLCEQQGLDAEDTFLDLVRRYMGARLRGPFNHAARLEAGFAEQELERLEAEF